MIFSLKKTQLIIISLFFLIIIPKNIRYQTLKSSLKRASIFTQKNSKVYIASPDALEDPWLGFNFLSQRNNSMQYGITGRKVFPDNIAALPKIISKISVVISHWNIYTDTLTRSGKIEFKNQDQVNNFCSQERINFCVGINYKGFIDFNFGISLNYAQITGYTLKEKLFVFDGFKNSDEIKESVKENIKSSITPLYFKYKKIVKDMEDKRVKNLATLEGEYKNNKIELNYKKRIFLTACISIIFSVNILQTMRIGIALTIYTDGAISLAPLLCAVISNTASSSFINAINEGIGEYFSKKIEKEENDKLEKLGELALGV